ncbi:hypothetical protein D3C73_1120900 [compost metagenome]
MARTVGPSSMATGTARRPLTGVRGSSTVPGGGTKASGATRRIRRAAKSMSVIAWFIISLPSRTGTGRPRAWAIADRSMTATVTPFSSAPPRRTSKPRAMETVSLPPVPMAVTPP